MANPQAECKRCGAKSDNFLPVDAGMRLALESLEPGLPDKVCASCYEQLGSSVSQGLKLRMENELKEKNKVMAWKNRVHLIKNARNLMTRKSYSEAAVQYEKYLRLMEVVHNIKKGELSPKLFNNSNRSKELTVIASVYWDLMRIYDTSPRYGDRMMASARKLGEFLPYSTIYPDILKKADAFLRNAKNPDPVKEFLRIVKAERGPCFIATAVYNESPYALELWIFRRFRDQWLRPYWAGRQLIWLYYRYSPPVARHLAGSQLKSRWMRGLLTKMAHVLKKSLKSS